MLAIRHDSPIGPLSLAARAGRLIGLRFASEAAIDAAPTLASPMDQTVLDRTRVQLDEYFAGQRQRFDVPLALQGTAFQTKVWTALYRIPYGETASYQHIATALGRGCARSVGTANGANPLSIIVPCHRVIASDGTLGGYVGGLRAKRHLLDLEAAAAGLFSARQ